MAADALGLPHQNDEAIDMRDGASRTWTRFSEQVKWPLGLVGPRTVVSQRHIGKERRKAQLK
jgi:hypothetical protein